MLVMFARTTPSRLGAAAIAPVEEPMPRSLITPESHSRHGRAWYR